MPVDIRDLNEGNTAFAVLERVRAYMNETGGFFMEHSQLHAPENVFPKHTAADAGFDRLSSESLRPYLSTYAQGGLGIAVPGMLALGRNNPDDVSEPFNMAHLAFTAAVP